MLLRQPSADAGIVFGGDMTDHLEPRVILGVNPRHHDDRLAALASDTAIALEHLADHSGFRIESRGRLDADVYRESPCTLRDPPPRAEPQSHNAQCRHGPYLSTSGVTILAPPQLITHRSIADGRTIRGYEIEKFLMVELGWHGRTLASQGSQARGQKWVDHST